jgi:hypothetical protein
MDPYPNPASMSSKPQLAKWPRFTVVVSREEPQLEIIAVI